MEVHHGMHPGCGGCLDRSCCRYVDLYSYMFESPWDHPFIRAAHEGLNPMMRRETYPQPFVLDPPEGGRYEPGQVLELPFTLVGESIGHFPFMACALDKLADRRLGKGDGRVALESIVDCSSEDGNETLVYDGEAKQIVAPFSVFDCDQVRRRVESSLSPEAKVEEIRISFLTPFRFRYGEELGPRLTFEIFMRNLFRRLTLLSVHSPLSFHFDHRKLLLLASEVRLKDQSELSPFHLSRHSNRHNPADLNGCMVGKAVFGGDLGIFLPFIKMGEILHVGKNGSFGLGKYAVSFGD